MSPVTHIGTMFPIPRPPTSLTHSSFVVSFKFNPNATADQQLGLYNAFMGLKDSCKKDGKAYILVCSFPLLPFTY